MLYAEDGWELKVRNQNFDQLPEIKPFKADGQYHFRGEKFN